MAERNHVTRDPRHLIVWREDGRIIGHALWHESNATEHTRGRPRDEKDKEVLEQLLDGKKDFVELHELWLGKEFRGQGYGVAFFDFFEDLVARRGHRSIVYYAFNPAALAICRKRGYKEAYGVETGGTTCWVFYLPLMKKGRI